MALYQISGLFTLRLSSFINAALSLTLLFCRGKFRGIKHHYRLKKHVHLQIMKESSLGHVHRETLYTIKNTEKWDQITNIMVQM